MNIPLPPRPSIERTQIRRLAGIVFGLTSFAAILGVAGTLYFLYALMIWLGRNVRSNTFSFDGNSILYVSLSITLAIGWWLYWTYWLEVNNRNRFSNVSWLLSVFFNGVIAPIMPIRAILTGSSVVETLGWGFMLLWFATITVMSFRIWRSRAKEKNHVGNGERE